ncbi:MAG: sugar phosphate isomerase/epimerase [Bryobacteraceae bacterium]|nr:sugar phosphate isomerase/epimerase [Bryobacteraceae bacterium]
MFTRRQLLATSLAVPALAGRKRIDFSRLSAVTDECAATEVGAVQFATNHGMKWVELRAVPGVKGASYHLWDEANLKATAKLHADAGIRVSFLNTPLLKHTLPGTVIDRKNESPENRQKREARDQMLFDRRLEDLRKTLRAAQILGTDKVRVFNFLRVAEPQAIYPRIAEVLNEMAKMAEAEHIHLLLENENSCNSVSCEETAEQLKLVPSKWVGINWDAMNGMGMKEQPFPAGYQKLPKKRLGNVQIKGKTLLDYPEKLDWKQIFAGLEKDGYTGQVGLETHIFGPQLFDHSHTCVETLKRLFAAS